jgi:hypothetical protein
MDVRRYSFLSLSIVALGALSNVASSAPPGFARDLKQQHKVPSHSGPIALQHSSDATSNVAAPTLTPLANQLAQRNHFHAAAD